MRVFPLTVNRLARLSQAEGIAFGGPDQTVVDEFVDGGLNVIGVKAHETRQSLRICSALAAHLFEDVFLNFA